MPNEQQLSANQTPGVDNRPWFFRYITAITRVWGIITVLVLWVFAVQALAEKNSKGSYTKWYLLGISPVITILEVLWVFDQCACCENDQRCCCKTWHAFLWIDGWRKTILYCALSAPCFVKGIVALYAVLYGLLLISLAFCYLLKSIKYSSCIEKQRTFPPDDPRSKLVNNESQPAAANNYSSTQPSSSARSSQNTDWPPAGYAEARDGSLYKVSSENEEKPSTNKSNKPSVHTSQDNKTDEPDSSFEPTASSEWPPPGFATAADGSIYASTNESSQQVQGRENPFNKEQLTQSTDSFNPFQT